MYQGWKDLDCRLHKIITIRKSESQNVSPDSNKIEGRVTKNYLTL